MKQKNFRLGWLIIAVMMLALVPKEVRAQEETLGAFTVIKGEGGECSFVDNKLTVKAGTVTVSTTEQTSQTIVLEGTAKLILAGVNISTDVASPIKVMGNDAVIELAEGTQSTLEVTVGNYAGIHVPVGSKVTFTGSGNLDVKNTRIDEAEGFSSCGIGGQQSGNSPYSCGTVIFDLDGTITAQGGCRGAGIGICTKIYYSTAVSGTILIKKGTINAAGGFCASGIGTGPDGSGSAKICVEGGTITVKGNHGSGGIGNGFNCNTIMHIAITGGYIEGNVGATGQAPYYKKLDQVIIGPDATVTGGAFEYTNGIIFDGNPKTATMVGDAIIPADITLNIDENETLIIPEGRKLTVEEGGVLTNNGTIIGKGNIINNGTLTNSGAIKYERTNLTIGNYGTICLPYAVAEKSGAEFFSIAGKKIENGSTWLVLKEVEGDLEAGKPYIFKANEETLSCTYSMGDAVENAGNDNGLIGCFTQITVPDNYYALKNNMIYKCSAEKTWNIAANRAYINMGDVSEYNPDASSSANHVVKMRVSGGTTGIDAVRTEQQDGVYYNMQGQRVASPSHGIYIVNGKKVIMK